MKKTLTKKLKVCVVVANRANYGRVKHLMIEIENNPELELILIVGASAILERFGNAVNIIEKDGFKPNKSIHYIVEGENLVTQAKSTGLGIIELASAFDDVKPDMVVTVADRFETISTAIAATYLNIPLIHLQGGEVSGNIDDRVRHSITKLADFHFVSTQQSFDRVVKMGERKHTVFNYGCPSIDILKNSDLTINNEVMSVYSGVGQKIDWTKPYLLMVQHPVTTSYGDGFAEISQTLSALKNIKDIQKVILWPNPDAGSDDVAKGMRQFRESNKKDIDFHFFKNFSPEDYARVLNNAICLVGNSSSFIREASYLGIPAVIIGNRQQNREHGKNVIFANYNSSDINEKIQTQINNGLFDNDLIFGNGESGKLIASELVKLNLKELKRNSY